jgi:hypothetical protein
VVQYFENEHVQVGFIGGGGGGRGTLFKNNSTPKITYTLNHVEQLYNLCLTVAYVASFCSFHESQKAQYCVRKSPPDDLVLSRFVQSAAKILSSARSLLLLPIYKSLTDLFTSEFSSAFSAFIPNLPHARFASRSIHSS